MANLGKMFKARQHKPANMTVKLNAGTLMDGTTLTEVASQSTGTINAPTTNPRIDRVVIDQSTGVVSVVNGTEVASPSAPAIPSGKIPIAQITLAVGQFKIRKNDISDERPVYIRELADGAVTLSKLASGTDGELITWDAAGDPATVAVGTSGQVLTSNGSGAAPSFQDAAGSGGHVVGSATASNSASLTITGIDDTYDTYQIIGANLVPVSSAYPWARVGNGGIDSGSGHYGYGCTSPYGHSSDASSSAAFPTSKITGDSGDSKMLLEHNNTINTGTGGGFSFVATLHNARSTLQTAITGTSSCGVNSGGLYTRRNWFQGVRLSASVIDRFQFLFSTGNITSDRLTVIGVPHV